MLLQDGCVIKIADGHGCSQGGQNRHSPLEIGTTKQKFLENVKSAV